jgi:hypothetical protein
MPFAVKKMDKLFSGFSANPQPITSPWPFHSGLIETFGHSKLCASLDSQQ